MNKLIYLIIILATVSCGNDKHRNNPMWLDLDKSKEMYEKEAEDIEKARELNMAWNQSLSSDDSLAFVNFVEKLINRVDSAGFVSHLAIHVYMMLDQYDAALNALEKMDNDYAELLYGDSFKDFIRLRILSIKAYASGDTASCKSYIKEGYKLMDSCFKKYESDIYEELDRQGDDINFQAKPASIVWQYSLMLYLEDENKYESFKNDLISRYPKFENPLQMFSMLPDPYKSYIGF